jgi:hypothetical protein
MSGRHVDNDPLRLPPEREVSPQLRARVLHNALKTTEAPATTRRLTRWVPYVAGLAAAAVVITVVTALQHGDSGEVPPVGGGEHRQMVGEHDAAAVTIHARKGVITRRARFWCQGLTGLDNAGHSLTTELLRSPVGPMTVGAIVNYPSQREGFCTPFGSSTSERNANMVSLQQPIVEVPGSRVQGLLPPRRDDSDRQVYYEGTWFAVAPGVGQIEARLVVGGEEGVWRATEAIHAFVYASTWKSLTPDQADSEVTVEYRAISADGELIPVPGLSSSRVIPAQQHHLPFDRLHP